MQASSKMLKMPTMRTTMAAVAAASKGTLKAVEILMTSHVITFTRTLPSYRRTYRRFLLILLSDQLPTTFIAWLIPIIGVIDIEIRMWNYLPNTRNTVQV